MDKHTSHPIKAEHVVFLTFPWGDGSGVHREGCAHTRKAESVHPFDEAGLLADDYVYVAPCARKV